MVNRAILSTGGYKRGGEANSLNTIQSRGQIIKNNNR